MLCINMNGYAYPCIITYIHVYPCISLIIPEFMSAAIVAQHKIVGPRKYIHTYIHTIFILVPKRLFREITSLSGRFLNLMEGLEFNKAIILFVLVGYEIGNSQRGT